MAGPIRTKKLLAEDFIDQKSWIGKLLQPFNQFLESVSSALNKQLTFTDNIDGMVTEVIVTQGFTNPVYFTPTTKTVPRGVVITQAYNLTDSAFSTSGALGLNWEYLHSSNQVKITNVFGLSSGDRYRLTLLVHTT